ncbi:hypothetical protein RJ55_04266 [Drechmeria coniospora]|nr:hypothetical protein RJ55_04266 [Drechmeria coniospora]
MEKKCTPASNMAIQTGRRNFMPADAGNAGDSDAPLAACSSKHLAAPCACNDEAARSPCHLDRRATSTAAPPRPPRHLDRRATSTGLAVVHGRPGAGTGRHERRRLT